MSDIKQVQRVVEAFNTKLKRREIKGSWNCGVETAKLLRLVVSITRWNNASTLMQIIKDVGKELVKAQPTEIVVGNIVRRVLHIIREEYLDDGEEDEFMAYGDNLLDETPSEMSLKSPPPGDSLPPVSLTSSPSQGSNMSLSNVFSSQPVGQASLLRTNSLRRTDSLGSASMKRVDSFRGQQPQSLLPSRASFLADSSMINLLTEVNQSEIDYSIPKCSLKTLVIQQIKDLIEEMEDLQSNIALQALEHIHTNEIIMTIGRSRTVEQFLLSAAKKRKFSVIVAETAPLYSGQELAVSLAKEGLDVTLIPDSAIYAMMGRVNKVILGCHAVMADGGLMSVAGSQQLAVAAKHHSTPVVVCTGLFKLAPVHPHDHDAFNLFLSPSSALPLKNNDGKVDVLQPSFDYVDAGLVTLFITNTGGHPPSYIYRLLGEMYDPRDYCL
ncbi:nagb/rpia/CoA transferase-like protein [Rozella allomycis CSF55]|uniref:Translation initiation factor eIF2B subunit beta n=1 Tax=Rozella allomycis (strain CSF55) TaxID=988480 RepID=A0A075ASJ4_ROZAC|nr:Initiation factor 2B-related domain-containing protein [Rozella allomycis CSF55]RKP21523.1 nagb/rpia/CoA transferase-like protein [Rozella allomycis CSF55]|eukprot:EPZ33256.1 Initiation factor 2B-related domain-containing protein [Rozella allomycis CSF55]